MLLHPNYRFEKCNSRKKFDSFKKKDLVLLEFFISDAKTGARKEWRSSDLLSAIKDTNRCRSKRSEGKIQTRTKK